MATTKMVHHVCHTCDMTATGVSNASMALAWYDHIVSHEPLAEASSFTWEVVPLEFNALED